MELQTVYALVVNSDLEIVLHTDSVTYYTTKDGTAYELKLSDASLRQGSGTDGREIVDALRKADTVSAGDYTLTQSWERSLSGTCHPKPEKRCRRATLLLFIQNDKNT